MRLLLDECVPKRLKRDLAEHDVWTVGEMGWSSKRNGELLKLMLAENLEAFLTVDQNLEFQQNVRRSGIGIVVASWNSVTGGINYAEYCPGYCAQRKN